MALEEGAVLAVRHPGGVVVPKGIEIFRLDRHTCERLERKSTSSAQTNLHI
jgi:hypothetical protein